MLKLFTLIVILLGFGCIISLWLMNRLIGWRGVCSSNNLYTLGIKLCFASSVLMFGAVNTCLISERMRFLIDDGRVYALGLTTKLVRGEPSLDMRSCCGLATFYS
jgi:hypothetical protein